MSYHRARRSRAGQLTDPHSVVLSETKRWRIEGVSLHLLFIKRPKDLTAFSHNSLHVGSACELFMLPQRSPSSHLTAAPAPPAPPAALTPPSRYHLPARIRMWQSGCPELLPLPSVRPEQSSDCTFPDTQRDPLIFSMLHFQSTLLT